MSHISYYAPLDEQLAESIRAKYRLLRSRRSQTDLHAASRTICGGEFEMNYRADYDADYDANPKTNRQLYYKTNYKMSYKMNYCENFQECHEENRQANHKGSYVASCIRCRSGLNARVYAIGVHLDGNEHDVRQSSGPAERRNRSEYRKRHSNGGPSKRLGSAVQAKRGRTFNAPTNLICESPVLLAYLATLLGSLCLVNCIFTANRILRPLTGRLQAQCRTLASTLTRRLACESTKIWRHSAGLYQHSTAKLSAVFRLFSYWIPFACLVVSFELNDFDFTFLKNLPAFLVLYLPVFTPLSIGYAVLYNGLVGEQQVSGRPKRQIASPTSLSSSRASQKIRSKSGRRGQAGREETSQAFFSNSSSSGQARNQTNKVLLLNRINKAVSLTLLCLVDHVLVRNGLRALQCARELSIAYLVESFVDNIVNYDQPKFNYLPEEENLSADQLKVLSFLTGFSLLRLAYSLTQLLFIDDRPDRRAIGDGPHRSRQESFSKNSSKHPSRPSRKGSKSRQQEHGNATDYKSKLRSHNRTMHQKETPEEMESNRTICPIQIKSSLEGKVEFLFITVRPVLLGSLSYGFLFATQLSCHALTACIVLLLLAAHLLAILLIDLEVLRVDFVLGRGEFISFEKLSNWLNGGKPACHSTHEPADDSIQLLNRLVLSSLFELALILCPLVLIGSTALLPFALIAQFAFFCLKLKRKLSSFDEL